MQKVSERLVNWASILDARTREQAERTAAMPFIHPHVALMPDAHLGRGATVGSVIPTLRAIMPAAVGVDIGCGMAAVRTQFDVGELRAKGSLAPLRESIERAIPLGAGHHNRKVVATSAPRVEELDEPRRGGRVRPVAGQEGVGGAARHAGQRQPLHRGHRRRGRPGVAVPALRVPGRGQQDRPAAHGRGARGAAPASSCPTPTSPTSRRTPRSSGPTSASCGGPSTTRCSTARR